MRLWRFAPTPVHGSLDGAAMLVTFPDPKDTSRATIRGVTGWESAQVADPADDFASLVGSMRPDAVDAALEAYRQVRVERPDDHLLARARLASELQLLGQLLTAVSGRDEVATEALTARLRRLDDAVHDERQARWLRIVPVGPVPVTGPESGELTGFSRPAPAGQPSAPDPQTAPVATSPDTTDDDPAVEIGHDDQPGDDTAEDSTLGADEDGTVDADATDVIDTVDAPAMGDDSDDAEPDDIDEHSDDIDERFEGTDGQSDVTDGDAVPEQDDSPR